MGEIINPALAGIQKQQGSKLPELRAKADAWSARNDLRAYKGSLRDLAGLCPAFDRRSLAGGDRAVARKDGTGKDGVGIARSHLDVIVRRAGPGVGLLEMPVGVVTRRHQLLPHARVIESLERALGVIRVDPAQTKAELDLTNFGARMSLAVDLPTHLDFDPVGSAPLNLRILLSNSVNGGGLRLLSVWQQQESGSTFAVGVTRLESRLAHRLPARLADIVPGVQRALEIAQAERAVLAQWNRQLVTRDQLVAWVDGSVRRMWGRTAAARIFHIAMTGWDAEPAFSVERESPSRRTMQATNPVPGAPAFVETAYDALLALGWIAREVRDTGERFDRIVETALLMRALLRSGAKPSSK
jgi:hypothetical protein